MGLEFGGFTHVWLGREDGGWEPLEGVTSIELEEESPSVEEASAVATEHSDTKLFSWGPACPSGRHRFHPGYTCDEHEELSQHFQDFIERLVAAAYAHAEEAARRYQDSLAQFLDGFDTWEPRGLLASLTEPYSPTPIERALEILGPHLAREPLYQPKVRMGHWLPDVTEAPAPVSEQPPSVLTPDDRPAWQSPYGPPSRRPR
ncbi:MULTISPECIES: hypothetical protein [Streptomyces]|uniref:Uncharacterized protein n=1 Tax=Streptomyces europaeiscabiei TaxID=146819 RepID=A0ABU4NQ54_9ACTN|nr:MULTISPECIES: hypothetical protein [Streptomyces]MBP5922154.1 hypothetical protein [Streptomyces sp. LBUM 1483]MDX3555214.1 hypothetical protein [Streptomyces europaeiscabiei]MDX3705228.1 hypothetical protein [Streptomyces europaeiscabiei]MDX3864361.1 hypothetical protein [Streptomyces europaeiscabiei]MDX3871557.1 hypothetical protein [Streptomyces europaeiscabiei]